MISTEWAPPQRTLPRPGYKSITPNHTTHITPNYLNRNNTFPLIYTSTAPCNSKEEAQEGRKKAGSRTRFSPLATKSHSEFDSEEPKLGVNIASDVIWTNLALKQTESVTVPSVGLT